jgi:hypothetical protein
MAGALQPEPFRGLAFNDCLRPPPGSKRPPGGGEGPCDGGRRPTSGPWRRRGRGGSTHDSRSAAEGTPRGWRARGPTRPPKEHQGDFGERQSGRDQGGRGERPVRVAVRWAGATGQAHRSLRCLSPPHDEMALSDPRQLGHGHATPFHRHRRRSEPRPAPISVVDEVERGLEPYRPRILIGPQACGSQAFATSHSPVRDRPGTGRFLLK